MVHYHRLSIPKMYGLESSRASCNLILPVLSPGCLIVSCATIVAFADYKSKIIGSHVD